MTRNILEAYIVGFATGSVVSVLIMIFIDKFL